ncbi:MAG: hypothetical protein RL549_660, partial [Verrucomicrobiota bacterium]
HFGVDFLFVVGLGLGRNEVDHPGHLFLADKSPLSPD